jgi:cob(I)alamin adenosyltransferase
MTLYTRAGDRGQTMLYGGKRLSKAHVRLHAYGTVDELSSLLGVILAEEIPEELERQLRTIQHTLYVLGADLATPLEPPTALIRVRREAVAELEQWINGAEAMVPPLTHFILPGGSRVGALLHQARTVCRRAERWVVALQEQERVNVAVQHYLNRLSDFLFAAARVINAEEGREEIKA